jgi:DNA-directed RNA polymerase specialized sigma24 family protein
VASQMPARWRGGRAEEVWAAHYAALAGWAAALTGDAERAHGIASAAFVRLFTSGHPDEARVTLYRAALHELEHGRHGRIARRSRWRNHARFLALAGLTVEDASLVLHRPERGVAAVFDRVKVEQLEALRAEEELRRDLPAAEAFPHQATGRDHVRREPRVRG